MYKSIQDIKQANRAAGRYFFSEATIRFFNSKVESGVIGGEYFVTSEQGPHGPRKFTTHRALPDGRIENVSEFQAFPTRGKAIKSLDT